MARTKKTEQTKETVTAVEKAPAVEKAAGQAEQQTVTVPAEAVMLDKKTSLANASPEMTGEMVTAELPDLNDPEQAAEQARMAQEFEQQNGESKKEPDRVSELENLVRDLQAQLAAQRPQIVQVSADTERVMMRFQSECADDNLASFGPNGMYGQVTGKTGTVIVPKAEWSRFMTEQVRYLLDTRKLIVLTGMTEDERLMYGVMYREGELLDQRAFVKLLDMGRDLIAIFPNLCESHKEMIARRFLTAYQNGDPRANDRELILALNELSKSDGRRKGLFAPIINSMNERDAE